MTHLTRAVLSTIILSLIVLQSISTSDSYARELTPLEAGSLPVASTNFMIADEHASLTDSDIDNYLIGETRLFWQDRYIADLLAYPEAAWSFNITVPDHEELYGHISNEELTVTSFVTYPTEVIDNPRPYDFPYHNSAYGSFQHMLMPGEQPKISKARDKYPLIVLSHGGSAHGVYDIGHANDLASQGYIVAVIMYGDNRNLKLFGNNEHRTYLRPLITKAVVDSLIKSPTFGSYIEADNVGISGHSFGGFTALASAGAKAGGEPNASTDPRTKAIVLAAPWVGRTHDGETYYAFGDENESLKNITIPTISFVATKDDITTPESILPAMKLLNGPTYVIELVDQPHTFEDGSWRDRNNWEIIFFNAHLKDDKAAQALLKEGTSMNGGNVDRQLMEYQRLPE